MIRSALDLLVASSNAFAASSNPQPSSGVQPVPAGRDAESLMIDAICQFARSGRAAQISAATPATSGDENDVPAALT